MHELLAKYVNEKERERQKQREQALIEEGLFEKEYAPDNGYSEEYCHSGWDEEQQCVRYYKPKAIPVTEEEFELFRAYRKASPVTCGKRSGVAVLLLVIAVLIYVGGFITGCFMGIQETHGYYSSSVEFVFELAMPYWAGCFVFGSFTLGFSEIVRLLKEINDK